jgi:hypothetical protein
VLHHGKEQVEEHELRAIEAHPEIRHLCPGDPVKFDVYSTSVNRAEVARPPESPLEGWSLFQMEIFKKQPLGQVPFRQELDLASEIASSKVWTGLRS